MRCFLTQGDFSKEVHVTFSTVSRWEGRKVKPNLTAMNNIKEFCLKYDIEYYNVEYEWINFTTVDSNS